MGGGICFPASEGKSRKSPPSSKLPLKIVTGNGPGTPTFPRHGGVALRFLEMQQQPQAHTLQ